MLEEKEKVSQEETKPLNEDTQKAAKEAIKNFVHDKVVKDSGISEEQSQILEEMLKEANMPVELSDEEFKLGPQELDVRKLNKRNLAQMQFRISTLNAVYLRNISKSLLDITNLLFVLLDKLGVKDIIKTSDVVLDKIAEENAKIQKENNK